MPKAVSRLSFNAEVHVRFRVRECEFGGVKCDNGKGLGSEYLGLPLYIIPPIKV